MDLIPPQLYRYQPPREYAFQNLATGQLWMSTPARFNDPLDCALQVVDPEFTDDQVRRVVQRLAANGVLDDEDIDLVVDPNGGINKRGRDELVQAHRDAIDAHLRTLTRELGVCCFAGRSDNMLMWSHYADGHQGFCLEFSTSGAPFRGARQVSYVSEVPSIAPESVLNAETRGSVGTAMLLTKYEAWQYEQEWRVVQRGGDVAVQYDPTLLTAVYIGSKMSDACADRICRDSSSSTPVYRMEIVPRQFAIRVGPRLN